MLTVLQIQSLGPVLSDARAFVVNLEICDRKTAAGHIVVAVTVNIEPGTSTFDEHKTSFCTKLRKDVNFKKSCSCDIF